MMEYWKLTPKKEYFGEALWSSIQYKSPIIVTAKDAQSARMRVTEMLDEIWVVDVDRQELQIPWLYNKFVTCDRLEDSPATSEGCKVTELFCDKCRSWRVSSVVISSATLHKIRDKKVCCENCNEQFVVDEVRVRELPCSEYRELVLQIT